MGSLTPSQQPEVVDRQRSSRRCRFRSIR